MIFFFVLLLSYICSPSTIGIAGDVQLNGHDPVLVLYGNGHLQLPLKALMLGGSEITYICGLYRKGRWAPLTRTTSRYHGPRQYIKSI